MSAFSSGWIRRFIATAEKLKQSARLRTDQQGRVRISYQYYVGLTLSIECNDFCKACIGFFLKIAMFKVVTILCIFNSPSVVSAFNLLRAAFRAKSSKLILLRCLRDLFKSVSLEATKHLYVSITGILPPIVEFTSFVIVNAFSLLTKIKKEARKERAAFLNWWEDFASKINVGLHNHLLIDNTLATDPISDHSSNISTKNKSKDYLFRVRVTEDTAQAQPNALLHAIIENIQQNDNETASESSSNDSDLDAFRLQPPPRVIISM